MEHIVFPWTLNNMFVLDLASGVGKFEEISWWLVKIVQHANCCNLCHITGERKKNRDLRKYQESKTSSASVCIIKSQLDNTPKLLHVRKEESVSCFHLPSYFKELLTKNLLFFFPTWFYNWVYWLSSIFKQLKSISFCCWLGFLDKQTPAERVKARMKLQLNETGKQSHPLLKFEIIMSFSCLNWSEDFLPYLAIMNSVIFMDPWKK
jgi:hypothetical protein